MKRGDIWRLTPIFQLRSQPYSSNLILEVICSSERLVNIYQTKRSQIPKDLFIIIDIYLVFNFYFCYLLHYIIYVIYYLLYILYYYYYNYLYPWESQDFQN
jgi:hypothetical protein